MPIYKGTIDSNGDYARLEIENFWSRYKKAVADNSPEVRCETFNIVGALFSFSPSELKVGKHFPSIIFIECDFNVPIKFNGNEECVNYFYFQDCKFFEPVTFLNSVFTNEIDFHQGSFEQKLLISKCKFERLTFSANAKRMEFFETNFSILSISNSGLGQQSTITDLFIDFRNNKGLIDITRIRVNKLTLKSTLGKDMELLLHDVLVQNLVFDDFLNNGRVKLFNLKPIPDTETEFLCKNSNLGKAEIANVPFNRIKKVNISASSILECSFINVIWQSGLT